MSNNEFFNDCFDKARSTLDIKSDDEEEKRKLIELIEIELTRLLFNPRVPAVLRNTLLGEGHD